MLVFPVGKPLTGFSAPTKLEFNDAMISDDPMPGIALLRDVSLVRGRRRATLWLLANNETNPLDIVYVGLQKTGCMSDMAYFGPALNNLALTNITREPVWPLPVQCSKKTSAEVLL